MIINSEDYRKKILGCFMGKNIGGTFGAPMEWYRGINEFEFYLQDLKGEPLPNDDLDIQILWLIALERTGIHCETSTLSEYFLSLLTPYWAEYGNCKANMKGGLTPPFAANYNNPYKDSCGAYIRSEIWACMCPGLPRAAAMYARNDAVIDHGDGEGTYAAVFCAVLESAAFVVSDFEKLVAIAKSYIPSDCGTAKAIDCVFDCYRKGKTWLEARDEIMEKYRGRSIFGISERDEKLGFKEGKLGYDAPSNIAFIILGWLYGEGDFGKMMARSVNCGEDTDCTAATLASLYGIMYGIDAIPEKWIKPIGRGIKTLCLDAGDLQGHIPADIDELTNRIEALTLTVINQPQYCKAVSVSGRQATDLSNLDPDALHADDYFKETLYREARGVMFKGSLFDSFIEYPGSPYVQTGAKTKIKLTFFHKFPVSNIINLRWLLPDTVDILPAPSGRFTIGITNAQYVSREFELTVNKFSGGVLRGVIELTAEGRHTVELIPVTLINDDLNQSEISCDQ